MGEEREGTPEEFAAMFGKARDESKESSAALPLGRRDVDFIRGLHPSAEEIERRRQEQDAEQQTLNLAKAERKRAEERWFVDSLLHPNYMYEDERGGEHA